MCFDILFLLTSAACVADERMRVIAIRDGDCITCLDADKTQPKIRLAGIDPPELNQPFGSRAKGRLVDTRSEEGCALGRSARTPEREGVRKPSQSHQPCRWLGYGNRRSETKTAVIALVLISNKR